MNKVLLIIVVVAESLAVQYYTTSYAAEADDPEAIIQQVIESRNKLESAEITVSESYEVNKTPDEAWKSMTNRYRFLFDASNVRIDTEHQGVSLEGRPGVSTEQAIFRSDGSAIIRPAYSKEPVIVTSNPSAFAGSKNLHIHPRLIGMFPTTIDLLWDYGIEDAFEYLRMGSISVEAVGMNSGERRIRLASEFQSTDEKPVSVKMVINPTAGYTIESILVSRPDFAYSLVVSNREWAPGIWFPRECVFERHIEGKLFIRTRAIVDDVKPLDSVPKSAFDLTAIELAQGRVVRKENEFYLWNGQKLVRHPEDDPVLSHRESVPVTPNNSWHWILIGNAVIFGVIACFLIRRTYFSE